VQQIFSSKQKLALVFVGWLCCATVAFAAPTPAEKFFQNLNSGEKQTVVIYGTSLSAGGAWALAVKGWFDTNYPSLVTFINCSGPGQNSSWGVTNLQSKVLARHPNLVLIEFSYNDAHDKFKMPVEQGAANLAQMVQAILKQDTNTTIVLQIMNVGWDAPNGNQSSSHRPQLEKYNLTYRLYAKEHNLPLLDHYPNWLRLKESEPEIFQAYVPDGTHPNKEGSIAVTWPSVREWLEQNKAASRVPK